LFRSRRTEGSGTSIKLICRKPSSHSARLRAGFTGSRPTRGWYCYSTSGSCPGTIKRHFLNIFPRKISSMVHRRLSKGSCVIYNDYINIKGEGTDRKSTSELQSRFDL